MRMNQWLAGLVLALGVVSPTAGQNQVSVYIDADANSATGCAAVLPGGGFSGAEFRVDVTVVSGAAPTIGAPARASCSGGTFGTATGSGGTSAVGLNSGVGSADVIEIGVPQTAVRPSPSLLFARVGFAASSAGGSDTLFPAGAGIAYGAPDPTAIPALSLIGVALLLLGVVFLARHAVKRSRLLLLSLLAFTTVAVAAGFVVDGQVADWIGETLYADALEDSTNAQASLDIAVAGAEAENGQVFFRIDIRDLQNQAPVALAQAVTTGEDTAADIILSGTDPDADALTFAIASPAASGTLSGVTQLTANTARVTYTPNPDSNGADSFSFTVTDGQINSLPATVSITVTSVNDAPVVNPAALSVGEDSPAGTDVGSITATDVDIGQTLTWEITAGNTGDAFSINPTTGLIEVATPSAIATPGAIFALSVQATDNGAPPLSGSATVTVEVTSINDAPSFTAGPNQTAVEDAGEQTVSPWATSISPGPPDEAGQIITFLVTGNTNAALFSSGPSVSPAGVLTFASAPNASGTATITLVAMDDGGTAGGGVDTSAPQTFTVTITPVNDAPVLTPGGGTVNFVEEGLAVLADANIAVSDIDSTTLAAATIAITANFQTAADVLAFTAGAGISGSFDDVTGTLSLTGDASLAAYETALRSVTFSNSSQVPDTAARTLTWTATDGSATSAPATTTIAITSVDTAPTAVNDAATVLEDSAANAIDVLDNDADPDAGPISIAAVTQPANGTAVITGGGTGLTYQPNANFCTPPVLAAANGITDDSFTYTLAPGGSVATVTLTVTCVEDDPVAVADSATVVEDSSASAIDVLANDTDVDGGPRSIASVTQPADGTVAITGAGTGLTYQPSMDYCNSVSGTPDTFTYTLAPGGSTATVSMTVTCADDAPVAVDDTTTVSEDSSANTLLVLANDTDIDGGPIAVTSVTQPGNGAVVIGGAGASVSYQPSPNFCNSVSGIADTFTYTLSPGGSTATVSVTVSCTDDAPVAVDDVATVAQGSGPNALDVLANDTDVDAGPIAVGSASQPVNGAVVITGGGTGLTYQPNAGYCNTPPGTAPDTFTYSLSPGGSTATVSVSVSCDAPPVAVADSATVAEDSGVSAINVLGNDTDTDGGPIAVSSVTQPANGAVVITGGGTGVTYQPNANYCNTPPGTSLDAFSYTLSPGGSTATVTVSVTCIDDTPDAVADAATVTEDSGANAISVLANDIDIDAGPISIASVTQPADGTVVITGGGTGLTYAPSANYCNAPPGTAPDTFTYTLNPGGSSTTVAMTVTCVDDDPVAVNDAATVDEDAGATAVPVLVNDTDAEGDPLTIASATQPANGTVVVTGLGTSLTYQPNANYCNSQVGGALDTFTYTLTPGGSTATVSMTVTCVDDPPVAVADSVTVIEDSGASAIAVLVNDTDVDAGPISVSAVTQPSNGVVVITGAGTGLTYSPGLNYCNNPPGVALDTFTYTLTPGGSSTSVTVSVTCVNDPPVADDETFSGNSRAVGNTSLVVNDPTDGAPDPAGPHKTVTGDILDGDTDVDGPNPLIVVAGTFATNDGGLVLIEADGDFTFFPAAGTSCSDTSDFFDYTVSDTHPTTPQTDVGRVTIAIADCVWYVDSAAAAGGTGRSHQPFNALSATNLAGVAGAGDADGSNQILFFYDGAYTGGLPLESGQSVLSQRHGLIVPDGGAGSLTLEVAVPAGPVSSIAGGLVLSSNNTVQGIDLGNAGTFALSGSAVGTATVNTVTSGTINNTTGGAVSINGGALNIVFASITSTAGANGIALQNVSGTFTGSGGTLSNATGATVSLSGGSTNFTFDGTINDDQGALVSIANETGGLKDFNGAVTDGNDGDGNGVSITGSTGATVRFDGVLTLATGANPAFSATGGGVVNITAATNTISTTTGAAFRVTAPSNIGASGVQFRSITVNNGAAASAANAIVLSGTTGAFSVTGDGAATGGFLNRNGSGGTLTRTTGHSVSLTNASNVTLRQMNITNTAAGGTCPGACNANGVNSTGGSNIVLSAVNFDTLGGHGWFARDLGGVNRVDQNSRFFNWIGSSTNGIGVAQNVNFTSFTVDRTLFSTSATGGDGFLFDVDAGSGAVVVTNSEFTLIDQDALQVNNDGPGAVSATVQSSNFHDADATGGDGNTTLFMGLAGSGQLNFTIGGATAAEGNTFTNLARLSANAGVLQVNAAGGLPPTGSAGARLNGTIRNNVLTNPGFVSQRRGIMIAAEASAGSHGGHTVAISDNSVQNFAGIGVYVSLVSVSGTFPSNDVLNNNITISGNQVGNLALVGQAGGDSGTAIELETNIDVANVSADISANVLIQNNTVRGNSNSGIGDVIEISNRNTGGNNTSTLNLTVLGNNLTQQNGAGQVFEARNQLTAGTTICLDLNAANVAAARNTATGGNGTGFRITNDAGTYRIDGLAAGAQTGAAVQTFLAARNTGAVSASNDGATFPSGAFQGEPSGCPLP